ncbi:MAG: Uma2 family endonuclease [Lachnospiraceae bacterium]|nr:Uma2 family endonuclease [Lachnospiraceae bacterium]
MDKEVSRENAMNSCESMEMSEEERSFYEDAFTSEEMEEATDDESLSGKKYDFLYEEALKELTAQMVSVTALQYGTKDQGEYTVEDYYALPDDQRVELIDGFFFDMEAPGFMHQRAVGEIYRQIANYITDPQGSCLPFVAPVDVRLDCNNRTMVQPDVGIVCDRDKVKRWGIYGAPDFLIEVLSPSTQMKDRLIKKSKYRDAGVREYWMVDLRKRRVLVFVFESVIDKGEPAIYGLGDHIPVRIYGGDLAVDMSAMLPWAGEEYPE